MNLTNELAAKKEEGSKKIPQDKREIMLGSIEKLKAEQLAKKALQVGDTMVNFTLPNSNGVGVTLADLLKKGKVIISFYRGGWCPYCNLELRAFQQILPEINQLGATLVAISPETPDNSLTTSEKNNLAFSVLSDIDNTVAKEIGLVFQMPEDLKEVYSAFNLDVSKHNGNNDYELPMPATYVVDVDGKILYAFIAEDYTLRAEPTELLSVL